MRSFESDNTDSKNTNNTSKKVWEKNHTRLINGFHVPGAEPLHLLVVPPHGVASEDELLALSGPLVTPVHGPQPPGIVNDAPEPITCGQIVRLSGGNYKKFQKFSNFSKKFKIEAQFNPLTPRKTQMSPFTEILF